MFDFGIEMTTMRDKKYHELHKIIDESKDVVELFQAIHSLGRTTGKYKREAFLLLEGMLNDPMPGKTIIDKDFLFTATVKALVDFNDPVALHVFIATTVEREEGEYRLAVLQEAIEILIYRNYRKSPAWPVNLVAYLFNNKDHNHHFGTIWSVTETVIKTGLSRVEVYSTLLVHVEEEVRRFAAEKLDQLENWQPVDDFQRAAYLAATEKYSELVAMGTTALEYYEFAACDYSTVAGNCRNERNVDVIKKLMINTVPHLPADDIVTVYLKWLATMKSLWSDGDESVYRAVEALPRPLDPAFVDKLEELAGITGGKQSGQLYRITRMLSWLSKSERAMDVLFSLVSDESIHERNRQQAVFDFSSTGDSRALESLLGILEDTKDYDLNKLKLGTRWNVIMSLGRLGDPRAFEPLLRILNDVNINTRSHVIQALGEVDALRAFEPLVKMLDDENDKVRLSAIRTLGELGDPRAFEPLVNMLEDEHEDVRYCTVLSLGRLGDPRAVELLKGIPDDEKPLVRNTVVEVLKILDDKV